MLETQGEQGAPMAVDGGARKEVLEFREPGASLSRLPRSVRFLGEVSAGTEPMSQSANGLYEFEVVTGNAAYREGERFYLTAAQAERVYLLVHHA
jgi:hypothetical protein